MSVRGPDRGETTLKVLDDARILAEYTLTICKNDKVFPKKYRWLLTSKLVNESIDIMREVRMANSIRVRVFVDYVARRRHQLEAAARVSSMYSLVALAEHTLSIESNRIKHWTKLIVGVDNSLSAWYHSDYKSAKNRFKTIPNVLPLDSDAKCDTIQLSTERLRLVASS